MIFWHACVNSRRAMPVILTT